MRLKKIMLILMSVCIGSSIFYGCGKEEATAKKDDNILVYASNDYTSINPALYEHGEINTLIFDGLTDRDKDNKITEGLAKKWEWNEQNKTYRFFLRDNVKWHDGEKFDASDVKFTIDTIKDPKNHSEIASNYDEIKEVKIIDNYTVDIIMSEKNVAILDYLTVGILPEHKLKGKDLVKDEFNKNPIGTGPYKMEKWDASQSITLTENSEYFKVDPSIEKVVFKIIEDPKVKVMQLKTGEVNLAQITPKDLESIKEDKGLNTYKIKTSDYRGIMYNFNSPLFKENRGLANALSYAIDREGIVKSVLLGNGEAAYSPIQRDKYNNKNMEKFEYNKEKAKEEIEKIGFKKNNEGIYEKVGKKLEFSIVCPESDAVRIDMANICAQNLKEIGVLAKVDIKREIDWKNQDSYLIGWGSPYDPDDHTYKVFGSEQNANYSMYSNKNVDEILKKARNTDKEEERIKLYKDFQNEIAKDMPYTFISYIDAIFVGDSNIKGVSESTILGHHGAGILWNVEEWKIE